MFRQQCLQEHDHGPRFYNFIFDHFIFKVIMKVQTYFQILTMHVSFFSLYFQYSLFDIGLLFILMVNCTSNLSYV